MGETAELCMQSAHDDGMATKTARFAACLTAEQDALIRRATEGDGTDLTNFTVMATLTRARGVLADLRLPTLDDTAWAARPPKETDQNGGVASRAACSAAARFCWRS